MQRISTFNHTSRWDVTKNSETKGQIGHEWWIIDRIYDPRFLEYCAAEWDG